MNEPLIRPMELSVAQEVLDAWTATCRYELMKAVKYKPERERWNSGAMMEVAVRHDGLNGLKFADDKPVLVLTLQTRNAAKLADMVVPHCQVHFGVRGRPMAFIELPNAKMTSPGLWTFNSGQDLREIRD